MNLPFRITEGYKSPVNGKRYLPDRVFPRSGWFFYLKYLGIVLRQRKAAIKGVYDDEAWALSSLEIFRLIEKCGGRFDITGIENLNKCKGPVVFVSNHMGTLETMVFPFLIAPIMKVTFVVKESLVDNKIFGDIMRSRNPITVGRKNSREDLVKVITDGRKLLSEGVSIIIFPQSTRQLNFDPDKFNSLGSKLASKSGVQVLPVAIKTDFWGNGKRMKELGPIDRKKTIYIDFGQAVDVDESGKASHEQVVRHIERKLKEWGE